MEAKVKDNRPVWVVPALVCVMTLVGLISLVELPVPPGRDQGIFLYHGWGLIEGLAPYKDMWDHKPPGIHFLYAVAIKLLGHRYVAVNVLDIFWRLATVVAVYVLAARLYGRREGLIAAIFYGVWAAVAGSGFWWTAQAEGFMVLPLALSVYYYLENKIWANVLSGICVATATLLKTTAFLMAILLLVFILATPRKTWEPYPKRSKALSYIYGIAIVAIPISLYFLFGYAFDDLWDTVVTFNLYHSGLTFPPSEFFKKFSFLFYFFPSFWLVVYVKAVFDPGERKKHLVLVTAWLGVTLLMVVAQRKYFLYHFFVFIGPAAVLAARGLGIVWEYALSRAAFLPKALVSLIAILWIVVGTSYWIRWVYWPYPIHYRSFEFMFGKIEKGEYFGRFIDPAGDLNLVEDRAVAAYVRDRTKPGDKFLVWGFEPLVNFWAMRFAPTRFNSDYPLTFKPHHQVTIRLREKWRNIFMDEMQKTPPIYIAVAHHDVNALEDESSDVQLKEFPQFESFLNNNYKRETQIGDFELFRKQ
jgi:hypothetical protein